MILPAGKLFRAYLGGALTEHEIKSKKDVEIGEPVKLGGYFSTFCVHGTRIVVRNCDVMPPMDVMRAARIAGEELRRQMIADMKASGELKIITVGPRQDNG